MKLKTTKNITHREIYGKVYASIDSPDETIGKTSQGKEAENMLHSFSLNNHFLQIATHFHSSKIFLFIRKTIFKTKEEGKIP